jgi:septum site-determining protein MinC
MNTPPFQFKGSLFTLPVLQLYTGDSGVLQRTLPSFLDKAPKFFLNTPLILDINGLSEQEVAFDPLLAVLRLNRLMPIGMVGGTKVQQSNGLMSGLPTLPRPATTVELTAPPPLLKAIKTATLVHPSTKIITQPIRSGTQIHAQGDLLIFNSVSAGAEVLSNGNIYVYGTLRGRALAGIAGDKNAHIICRHLQAELIAIAGVYTIEEKLLTTAHDLNHIYLEQDALKISPL